jgi:hypothetical protein
MDVRVKYELGGPGATGRLLVMPSRGAACCVPIVVDVEDAPFDVHAVLDQEGDFVACQELTFRRRPGGPPVTKEALKAFPLRNMIEAAVKKASPWQYDRETGVLTFDAEADTSGVARAFVRPRPSGGTAFITDDQLKEVAAVYVEAKRDKRRDTNDAIADRFQVSRTTAARAVKRARAAGHHLPTRREDLQ